MAADSNRLEAIFAESLGKASLAERAAYLDQACGVEIGLRRRLDALLKAHDEAGSFLREPVVQMSATTDKSVGLDEIPLPANLEGPGTRIGPYKLLQQIGEGGMGVVYMAEQEQPFKRRVALKIIKPGMDSAQVIARFEAERQALAIMEHPNIAKVLDAGTTESGRPYFVMELVYGVPITRFCDEYRLTPRQRLELFVPVCHAIQHAHQRGVIHRDVKPSNVLVTLHDDKPVPKVIDFGVAKALQQKLTEKTLFTHFGAVVGTLEYMSPEQAEMNALGVDTRSDIYSLGVLLYELLTGTTPLERDRLRHAAYSEVLRLIKEEEPPRPSVRLSSSGDLPSIAAARKTEATRLPAAIRGEIDWIVMRCLEKDRTRRYESASALARDVEHHLRDEAVDACPPSFAYRLQKIVRRNRVVLATATAFICLLLAATVTSTVLAIQAKRAQVLANIQRDRAQTERTRASESAAEARASAQETRSALDRLTVAKGTKLAEEGDLFRALLWFAKPLERGGLTPEEEIVHRTRIACYLRYAKVRPVLRQMFFQEAPVTQAAFSPDVKQVLTVSGALVRLWNLARGEPLATLRHPERVESACFAPDGAHVLTTTTSAAWTWDAKSGSRSREPLVDRIAVLQQAFWPTPGILSPIAPIFSMIGVPVVMSEPALSVEISRDGRRALFFHEGMLRLLDLESRKPVGQWLRDKDAANDHALSPDGNRLLLIRDGRAKVHDTSAGSQRVRAIDHGSPVASVAFSPDGTRALSIGTDGSAQVWDAMSWEPRTRIAALPSESRERGAFSPDNRHIAFWSNWVGGLQALAWCDSQSGRVVREVADSDNDLQSFDWRPDGQQLLRVSKWGEVTLWSAFDRWQAGMPLPVASAPGAVNADRPIAGPATGDWSHGWPIGAAVYAPDGRTFLTATSDGVVRIWDLVHDDGDVQDPVPLEVHWDSAITPATVTGMQHITYGGNYNWSVPLVTHVEKRSVPDISRIMGLVAAGTALEDGAVSADGRRVLTRHDAVIQLWNASTRERVGLPLDFEPFINFASFSPDSRRFVVASNAPAARVFDAQSGKPVGAPLRHQGPIMRAAFSPDSRRIITCSRDGTARVWETETTGPVGKDLLHGGAVSCAAFSPSGDMVVTASLDRTMRLLARQARGSRRRDRAQGEQRLGRCLCPERPARAGSGWSSCTDLGRRLAPRGGPKARRIREFAARTGTLFR